jgi:hypothetical protein
MSVLDGSMKGGLLQHRGARRDGERKPLQKFG